MAKLLAATVAAIAMCAPALAASVSQRGLEQNGVVWSPAALPRAQVGAKYDVTLSATQNGIPLDVSTQYTRTTSSQAAPGIDFKQVTVNARASSGLELVGIPTKPGTYPLPTCAVDSALDCFQKQWTLVVTGKKRTPSWVAKAQDAKLALEQALRDEFAAEPLIKDFSYARALTLIDRSEKAVQDALADVKPTEDILPPGSSTRGDAAEASDYALLAGERDRAVTAAIHSADSETGDKEQASRELALKSLTTAIHDKQTGIDAVGRLIAAGEAG